ncbi:ABC transporter ATP-binding protein [Microbacterium gubbeenense]|uniref:ABC transporter ATP-binding protein n=1 Tax=Microbacterium TaxID=33882 RepID=UPI003F963FFE
MVNNSAVEVRGLQVVRGRARVFDGLDVDIASGRITGLLGPSGCGKTTLLRAIVGVQKTRGGSVSVLGMPAGSRRLRRRVAYATQSAAVYDDISVRANLRYFARLVGTDRRDADRVLDVVGLAAYAATRVGDLSGGQRGRVSLATALLGAPDVVVLDEPTVGLDPVLRAELWNTFRRLAETGTTLIISSHVMDEAARCDRLLLMREGRIIADTTPNALLADTGARHAEDAFLRIVQRDAAHPVVSVSAAAPLTRRERRTGS